jgi:hypothetical protein
LNDFRIIPDKAEIEVSKPQEYTDIFEVARGFPILDSGNLFWIYFDSFCTNDETQVFDFLVMELILLWFEVQAYLLKGLQDLVDIFLVFLKGIRVDQCVMEICSTESIKVGGKDIVKCAPKSLWLARGDRGTWVHICPLA